MAVTFKDGKGNEIGKRVNAYNLDPRTVVIDPQLNGRHELPEIETLIADMLSKPDGVSIKGQTTPVIIRRDGTKPVLVAGHRRLRAVLEINKRKLLPEALPLLCSYMQLTEVEALAVAVTENRERAGVTPIDEAFCVKQFLRLGKDHEWIALHGGFFPELGLKYAQGAVKDDANGFRGELKKATAWVKKREKLLGLSDEAQEAVSSGKLKVSAAEHLAGLEKEKQRDLLKHQKTSTKEIQEASGKTLKLSAKQVRDEIDNAVSDGAVGDTKIPKAVLDWLVNLRDRM